MKSRFALSFGIALIAVGVVNLFLETSNVILFGISLSAFIFSLLSIFFSYKVNTEKYEMIYIFPLLIMLMFFCYGNELMKIELVKSVINSQLNSALTFISFGLLFASEYIIEKRFKIYEQIRHLSLVREMMDYTELIQDAIIAYRREQLDKETIIDDTSDKFVKSIEKLYREKLKKARIEGNLLSLEKDKYTIDDFDKAYMQETEILHPKPIPKINNKKKNK